MAAIVPRWEWRTFGPGVEIAAPHFAALESTGIQESNESYLLSRTRPRPKARDVVMDIKVLIEVDGAGLEEWRPIMKTAFPLAAGDAGKAFEALGLEAPAMGRDTYTFEEFVTELAPLGGLRPVAVHKRRVRYVINGCTSEVTDVIADGIAGRTLAIESTDAQAVADAVASVGLGEYVNTSYSRGLEAILDRIPPRYAVIDAGTNSIKFHVGERRPDGSWRTAVDRAEVTRLGEGLEETGAIAPAAIERAAEAIAGMVEEAEREHALAIAAVGTAGLRIASNQADVLAAIRQRAHVTIRVISGEEESRLAYLAVKAGIGLAEGRLAVFDTGGGSTQLTFGSGDRVDERWSVNVGAVKYTDQFGLGGAVSDVTLAAALAEISADLSRLDGREPVDALVGMGGAITNITAVKHQLATYDPDVVQGTVLTRDEIDRQIELYRTRDAGARREIVGLQPKRADVILAGACVVRTVMEKLGRDSLTVSDRGLRHGLIAERFEG
jgi:exopolyphosphatase/guanosine-5'-triphosphate,3'-diphosphate pyrophosphatase